MGRVIIDYHEPVTLHRALQVVWIATKSGKISEAGGVKHYCWHTTFTDGLAVTTRRKKKGQESDSFIVSSLGPQTRKENS